MIKIKNVSKVPFCFNLRVLGDEVSQVQEFKIEPQHKQIDQGETVHISIVFTPAQAIH